MAETMLMKLQSMGWRPISPKKPINELSAIIRVCSTTQPPKISAKTAVPQRDKALT